MLKDVYLARLERLYGGYLKTVQDLEDSRKLGEGMFGFKGGHRGSDGAPVPGGRQSPL